jgi:hypothetical protein
MNAAATVPAIREMLNYQMLFITISSTQFQNLSTKVRQVIKDVEPTPPSYFPEGKWRKEEMPVLRYLSGNKVKAFEDCIMFAPHLFRL